MKFNVLNAQETQIITIGEGSGTQQSPIFTDYNYTITQQIYSESEIKGVLGNISKITFYVETDGANQNRNLKVYLKGTEKETFTSLSDWETISSTDLVFDGSVEIGSSEVNINLSKPFYYSGGNIVLCVDDNTGSCENSSKFYCYETGKKTGLYNRSDYTNFNPEEPGDAYNYQCVTYPSDKYYNPKVSFTIEAAADDGLEPAIPTDLVTTVNDHQSISLTWNAAENAQKYNIYQDGVKIATTTETSYIVEELEAETNYCFTVTGVRGTKESDSSNEACATTAKAPQVVTIGSGDETNSMLPTYTYFDYSLTQQIYTASEINKGAGLITSIALKPATDNMSRKIVIYMINTTDSSISTENGSKTYLIDEDPLYEGTVDFGNAREWKTITLTTPFEYDGGNVLLCISDITGSFYNGEQYFYVYNSDVYSSVCRYRDNSMYDPTSEQYAVVESGMYQTSIYAKKLKNQVQFTFAAQEPSVEVSETSIDLGNVRMGDFWSEKTSSQDVEVKVTSTTVTDVTCDNSFFTLTNIPTGDDLGKTFTFKVGYDKEADVTGTQNGTITIEWQDGEDITIPVSATPYTATEPDAMEVVKTIPFANNIFEDTPTFANLHDDYILPGETEDGNTPDAIYKFTLDTELTLSASIKGDGITNKYLAIYSEDFGDKEGPSFDNNNPGIQSVPQGPTTFGPYFESVDEWNNNFVNNGTGWSYYDQNSWESDIYVSSGAVWMLTKEKYFITSTSKLSFDLEVFGAPEIVVCASENSDGTNLEALPTTYSTTCNGNAADLSSFQGRSVHIGFIVNKTGNGSMIDNLALTDGSSKSRAAGLAAIEGVPYPAGTYYLVAAADKAFTVEAKIEGVPAPEAFALTAPTDEATEQNNPKLTWDASKYASSYNVYLGTSEDLTDVEPIEVTSNSYKTENLSNNTRYYWTVEAVNNNENSPTKTTSGTWSFVTTLDVPQGVATLNNEIVTIGDKITISWTEIDDATSYNVYVGDKIVNTEAIEDKEYTFAINAYNGTDGVDITVTAVYDGLGESMASEAVNVKVRGKGTIEGIVTDGSNVISGANVTIAGTEEFGETKTYNTITNENGEFKVEALYGSYTMTISKFDYRDAIEEVVVASNIVKKITLQQNPTAGEIEVTALDNYDNANISWKSSTTTDVIGDVYRKDLATDEIKELGSATNNYLDEEWADFTVGAQYQYGITTLVEETITLMNDGFETEGPSVEGSLYNNTFLWKRINKANEDAWYNNNEGQTCYVDTYNGSYAMFAGNPYGYDYKDRSTTFITKEIDLTDCLSANLSFYLINISTGDFAEDLKVLVREVGTEEWNILKTIGSKIENWEKQEISLENNYLGKKIELGFNTVQNLSRIIGVDDIVVTATRNADSRVYWSEAVTKEAWSIFTGKNGTTWNDASNWEGGYPGTSNEILNVIIEAPAVSTNASVKNVVIKEDASLTIESGTLTVGGKLTNDNDSRRLIIKDGAQVYQNNENVKATFNMEINNPDTWSQHSTDGWNFVSSPFTNAALSQFVFNVDNSGLDLYRYNGNYEGEEWRNYNVEGNTEFETANFDSGVGYLLAHENKEVVSLYGSLNNAKFNTWKLTYTKGKNYANFHLLGNPFTFDMDLRGFHFENMVEGCAVLNAEGNAYVYKTTTGNIPVGDAFFVKTTNDNPSVSYGNANSKRGETESINLIATGAEGSDNVIINLAGAENEGFNKLQNFNEGIANIFIAKNDLRYGIANFDNDVTMIDVAFEAKEMGNYTIAAQPNGKFKTLTLVDRFTGIETNLLVEDYHFTATSKEDYNRFIVKLEVNSQEPTANGNFAYVSGEDLILNIEGSVQIIDMMGRVVYSSEVESANNRINVSELNNAAYIIRVVNENGVKVQKIIL